MTEWYKTVGNERIGPVRVVIQKNEPWFIARDITTALGHRNPAATIRICCKSSKLLKTTVEVVAAFPTFPPRGMLIIPESDVFTLIDRSELISGEEKEKIITSFQRNGFLQHVSFYSRLEIEFLYVLEEMLKPMGIVGRRQFAIGKYLIDFYIPSLKAAIEYDENGHQHYDSDKEQQREDFIKTELNCRIIRVSSKDSHYWNVGKIISKLLLEEELVLGGGFMEEYRRPRLRRRKNATLRLVA